MSEKMLERCPCCGDASDYDTDEEIDGWFAFCMNRSCGCRSGIFPTKPMARNAWNTRASSPAQEPITTEPVAWRHGIWHYPGPEEIKQALHAAWDNSRDGFEIDKMVDAILALTAPPQPGRDDSELEELVAQAIWEECCPGMKWGQIDHLIYCRMAGAAIARMRALTGEPK